MTDTDKRQGIYAVRALVTLALLTALEVVLTRFLSVRTPIVTVGFGFVPVALAGMLYGVLGGAIVGGLSDLAGALLFPIGPYFPGFTLTCALIGAVYGLCFCGREYSFPRVFCAAAVNVLLFSLCLDTYWVYLISGVPFSALLPARLIKAGIMLPVQLLLLPMLRRRIFPLLRR